LNVGQVALVSPRIKIKPERALETRFWAKSDFHDGENGSRLTLIARYWNAPDLPLLVEEELWSSGSSGGWQEVIVEHQAPVGATEMELELRAEFLNGQIAIDNVAVMDLAGRLLAGWDFNSPPEPDGWSVISSPDYRAGTAYWAADGGHWGNLASPQPTGGYVLTNAGGGLWQTALYATAAGQSYQVQAALRGQATWFRSARWQVHFFDENGAENGSQLLWSNVSSLNEDSWQEVDQTFTIPAGTTHFQLALDAPQLGGWLALDGVRLASLSQPIPASGERDYSLSALVAGQAAAAGQESAALLVTYYDNDGSQIGSDTVWGGVDYNQVPAALQSGSFTTPAGTAHIRLGLAAGIDNDAAAGWLLYDRIALTALSQPITIVPGRSYEVSAQVAGELNGPAGEVSGQLAAHFYDSQGNLLAVSPIWQSNAYEQPATPLTHSGSVSHATATQMRLGLMTVLDEGWLDFSEPHLQWLHLHHARTNGGIHHYPQNVQLCRSDHRHPHQRQRRRGQRPVLHPQRPPGQHQRHELWAGARPTG
jgi:hypothetical protein